MQSISPLRLPRKRKDHLAETVPEGERAAVLMNEFGKAGVDGDVVRKKGLEIIEISRGSIFCACAKGDFLKALYTIFRFGIPMKHIRPGHKHFMDGLPLGNFIAMKQIR